MCLSARGLERGAHHAAKVNTMSLRRFGREEPPFPLALRAPPSTLRHTCQYTSVPKPPPNAIELARLPRLFAESIPLSAVLSAYQHSTSSHTSTIYYLTASSAHLDVDMAF